MSKIRTIAITGGKGGVGKTHTAVNLSAALSLQGQRVMLLDGDLGLSNVDIMLKLHPKYDLFDVIQGDKSMQEIVMDAPLGLKVLPGASGIQSMAQLSPNIYGGLVQSMSEFMHDIDTLVIDSAAGINDINCRFAQSAQEVFVVLTPEPTSMTDAYALIKVLALQYGVKRFRIVANMVQSSAEGSKLFAKLTNVTDKFLSVPLHYLGHIPEDTFAKKAILEQKLLMEAYPGAHSAQAFRDLAKMVSRLPKPTQATGCLEFFMEQFVGHQAAGVST